MFLKETKKNEMITNFEEEISILKVKCECSSATLSWQMHQIVQGLHGFLEKSPPNRFTTWMTHPSLDNLPSGQLVPQSIRPQKDTPPSLQNAKFEKW